MAKASTAIVIHDQTINTYGIIVLTSGIDWTRFDRNPVMLYNHDEDCILGNWLDRTVTGDVVTATPNFNSNNEEAAEHEQEYNDGFLKGASMRFDFSFDDVIIDPKYGFDQTPVLIKAVAMEGSLCPLPSNMNALQCHVDGQAISPAEFKQKLTLKLSARSEAALPSQKINSHMKNLALLLAALSLSADTTEEAAIAEAVKRINAAKELEDKVKTLELAAKAANDARVNELIADGRAAGKITAETEATIKLSAETNYEATKAMLAMIPSKADAAAAHKPAHKPLSEIAKVQLSAATGGGTLELSAKTYDDMAAAGTLAALKSSDPDTFEQLQALKLAAVKSKRK